MPVAGDRLRGGVRPHDADGRLTGIATSPSLQDLTLGYDALDRLTSATGSYDSLTYSWDAGGNRSSRA